MNLFRCFYIVHRKNREENSRNIQLVIVQPWMTIISDLAGSPDPSYLLENIVAIIKMGVYVFFKRAFSKWGNGWVHYIILFSNDVMRQFCKCTWTFWKACFLPKKKNHLLVFYARLLRANVTSNLYSFLYLKNDFEHFIS